MTLSTIVAWNLRTLRSQRKLTQGTVAAEAGASVSYISMLERGERAPSLQMLQALAKAFGVPPLSLLKRL